MTKCGGNPTHAGVLCWVSLLQMGPMPMTMRLLQLRYPCTRRGTGGDDEILRSRRAPHVLADAAVEEAAEERREAAAVVVGAVVVRVGGAVVAAAVARDA